MSSQADLLDWLKSSVIDQHIHVTYKSLSKKYNISVTLAKQILYQFYNENKNDLAPIYCISGITSLNQIHTIKLVTASDLEVAQKMFSSVISKHIYSISTKIPTDSNQLWLADRQLVQGNPQFLIEELGKVHITSAIIAPSKLLHACSSESTLLPISSKEEESPGIVNLTEVSKVDDKSSYLSTIPPGLCTSTKTKIESSPAILVQALKPSQQKVISTISTPENLLSILKPVNKKSIGVTKPRITNTKHNYMERYTAINTKSEEGNNSEYPLYRDSKFTTSLPTSSLIEPPLDLDASFNQQLVLSEQVYQDSHFQVKPGESNAQVENRKPISGAWTREDIKNDDLDRPQKDAIDYVLLDTIDYSFEDSDEAQQPLRKLKRSISDTFYDEDENDDYPICTKQEEMALKHRSSVLDHKSKKNLDVKSHLQASHKKRDECPQNKEVHLYGNEELEMDHQSRTQSYKMNTKGTLNAFYLTKPISKTLNTKTIVTLDKDQINQPNNHSSLYIYHSELPSSQSKQMRQGFDVQTFINDRGYTETKQIEKWHIIDENEQVKNVSSLSADNAILKSTTYPDLQLSEGSNNKTNPALSIASDGISQVPSKKRDIAANAANSKSHVNQDSSADSDLGTRDGKNHALDPKRQPIKAKNILSFFSKVN